MKKIRNLFLTLICFLVVFAITSCSGKDITSTLKLDRDPAKLSYSTDGIGVVTLSSAVDGDTANFNTDTGYVKVRFFAIDTPESTGDIDKWGLAASKYTAERLKNAASIVLESNTDRPNQDNYGRDLAYVWYKPTEKDDYRNLCLELVEAGYSANTQKQGAKYGDYFAKAEAKAQKDKKIIWSNDKDELFSDTPTDYDLKYICENDDKLYYKMVRVKAYIVDVSDKYVTIENFIDGKYYQYTMYMHNTFAPILTTRGNLCEIVGTVQPHNGGYQISGVQYNKMNGYNSKLLTAGYYLTFGPKPNALNPAYNFNNILVEDVTLDGDIYTFTGTAERYSTRPQKVKVTFTVPKGDIDFKSYVGEYISTKGYNENGTKKAATEVSFAVRSAEEIKLA